MYRRIQNKFSNAELTPNSRLIELPYIGPYIYERLRRKFAPRAQNITIRQFCRNTKNMSTVVLKDNLQRALQNERANQCVGRPGRRYHVGDINEQGYRTMVALLRVLKHGADGHGLGANMLANPQYIKYPNARTEAAKFAACRNRQRCRSPYRWRGGSCQYADDSGFQGVGTYPGQQIISKSPRHIRELLARGNTLERTARDRRRDPDTARDMREGHGVMRYSKVDDNRLQRIPGPIIRLPL